MFPCITSVVSCIALTRNFAHTMYLTLISQIPKMEVQSQALDMWTSAYPKQRLQKKKTNPKTQNKTTNKPTKKLQKTKTPNQNQTKNKQKTPLRLLKCQPKIWS